MLHMCLAIHMESVQSKTFMQYLGLFVNDTMIRTHLLLTRTGTFSGRAFVPTAERECTPAAPNNFPRKSEHPLITAGCCSNPSTQFTNPTSFTIRLILSRSPSSSGKHHVIITAHISARVHKKINRVTLDNTKTTKDVSL